MQRPPTVRLNYSGTCENENYATLETCQCYAAANSDVDGACLNRSYCDNQCRDPVSNNYIGGCTADGKCKSKLDQSCSPECETNPYFMGEHVPKGGDCTACNVLYEGTGTCSIKGGNVPYDECGTCSSNTGCGQCTQQQNKSACEDYTDCNTGNDCVWTPGDYTPTYSYGYGLPENSKGYMQACDISDLATCSSGYSCNEYTLTGGEKGRRCGLCINTGQSCSTGIDDPNVCCNSNDHCVIGTSTGYSTYTGYQCLPIDCNT